MNNKMNMNNSATYITVPSNDAVSATGFMSPYLDNTNWSTNMTGDITTY